MCWAMSAEAPQTEHLKLSEQDVAPRRPRPHTHAARRFSTRLEISGDGAEIEGTAHQRALVKLAVSMILQQLTAGRSTPIRRLECATSPHSASRRRPLASCSAPRA